MAITDGSRHQLHLSLDHVLGEENAAVLMGHLPPVGWADVATRRDLDHLQIMIKKDLELVRYELRTEMSELRTDMRTEMSELRAELQTQMSELRADLGTEIVAVRTDLGTEIVGVRTEISRLDLRMEQLFTRFLLQFTGAMAGLLALFFTLSRLL